MGGLDRLGKLFRQSVTVSSVYHKLLQNCKYCRSDTLILIDLKTNDETNRETFVKLLNVDL